MLLVQFRPIICMYGHFMRIEFVALTMSGDRNVAAHFSFPPSRRSDGLFFFNKLNDTIDTNGFAGLRINEDVRRVHVFKV